MSISSNYFKLGTMVSGLYTGASGNATFSVDGVVKTDITTNSEYLVFNLTGASASAANLYLPPKPGNYAFVSNMTGTVVSVYCGTSSTAVTIANTECAALFCNGTLYQKATATSATLDIGSYTATTAITGASLFLVKLSDGSTHSVTYATLAALLGLAPNASIIVANCCATSNITLSDLQTIDGQSVTAGMIVFASNQTTQTQNGVYVVASGAWTRVGQMTANTGASSILVAVQFGTANAGLWICQNAAGSDIVQVNNLTWRNMSSAYSYPMTLRQPAALLYTNNVSLNSWPANQDGDAPAAAGVRVLLSGQTDATQNGLWATSVHDGGPWSRPADMAAGASASCALVPIAPFPGVAHGGSWWACTNAPGYDVVGASPLVFSPYMLNYGDATHSDVQWDGTQFPRVVIVSGDPTDKIVTETSYQHVDVAKAAANLSTAINTGSTIIRETALDANNIYATIGWSTPKSYDSNACRFGKYRISQEVTLSTSGGTLTFPVASTDSVFNSHHGTIHLHIKSYLTSGNADFASDIFFSATHAHRAGCTGSTTDYAARNWNYTAGGTALQWGAGEPALSWAMSYNTSTGLYDFVLTCAAFSSINHAATITLDVDIVAKHTAATLT